mmetsp:Transcript_21869/g.73588  ORF Transcript_21869/g.73588 Transcript_21869/m.73588 type:complete len:200 (-) Transcript_21869:868-1467(-)
MLLEAVNPRVAHAVGELLLLAPEHLLGQVLDALHLVVVKGLAHDPFLEVLGLRALALGELVVGVGVHDRVQEVLVQKGHAHLEAPGHGSLVGAQAVVHVEHAKLADALLVELAPVGRLVEVEVAREGLVRALPREHHLDAQALDLARQQKHGRPRPNGGHVVRLKVVDHVRDGVDALLHGEDERVVVRAQEVRHALRGH